MSDSKNQRFAVCGTITGRSSGTPLAGLTVRAYDKDFFRTQEIGETRTNDEGGYRIGFSREDFTGPVLKLEWKPDIFLMVFDANGTLLHSTESSTVVNSGTETRIDLSIDDRTRGPLPDQPDIRRKLDPRLRRMLSFAPKARAAKRMGEIDKLNELVEGEKEESGEADKKPTLGPRLFSALQHGLYVPELMKVHPVPRFKEHYVSAFIKFHGNRKDLENLGAVVRSRAGDVFTVFLPVSLVERLASMPAVEQIELPKPIYPSIDNAVTNHQIDTLHDAAPAVTGNGVIVGVYDSLLDLYHLNFRNDDGDGTDGNGSSRVLYLWDQNLVAEADENTPQDNEASLSWDYGVEYTQADINSELDKDAADPAYAIVRHGGQTGRHGTRVAGNAAGNGRAPGDGGEPAGTFVGAAPEADIIFVGWKSGHHVDPTGVTPYTDNAFLADGLAYIFERADLLGQPCVINVSESDEQGPHDGSSLGQQFVDNLLDGPGKAICLAAGNSQTQNHHAFGQVAAGGTEDVTLAYAASANNDDLVQIWYDGHDRISLTVTEPGGTVHGPVAPGSVSAYVLSNGQNMTIDSRLDDPNNHDNSITIIIEAAGGAAGQIPVGDWTLALTGDTVVNGRFNIWVDKNNRNESNFQAPHNTSSLTLGDLATTRKPITVGATDPAENIAFYSGQGPSRDGRIKPEIAAIGGSTPFAANGMDTVRSRNMNAAVLGDNYMRTAGTSFAAPVVTGTSALLLECQGAGLTWVDIKQILLNNADTIGIAVPHNGYGWGRLRAATICTSDPADVDLWIRMTGTDLGAEPFAGTFWWESPDIELLDAALNPVPNPVHGTDCFVRVTARNRGAQTARNVEVFLFWGDPATEMPYPDAWQYSALYTSVDGGASYTVLGNKVVIPEIPAGGDAAVIFRWEPPEPGTNIRGDDHFCLLAYCENESDKLDVAAGETWWPLVRTDNNITVRNVHVQEIEEDGDALFAFYVHGSRFTDKLVFEADWAAADMAIILPQAALPIRDMDYINRLGGKPLPYPLQALCPSKVRFERKALKGAEVVSIAGITGADYLRYEGDLAHVLARKDRVELESVELQPGMRMPVQVKVGKLKFREKRHFLRVTQLSDGVPVGGVTLELRKK